MAMHNSLTWLLCVALLCLGPPLSAQAAREVVALNHMAQGLSWDPENGCVYMMFRYFVKLHCRNAALGFSTPTTVIEEDTLGGTYIISWADTTTENGYLFIMATSPLLPPNLARLGTMRKARAPLESVIPILDKDLHIFISSTEFRNAFDLTFSDDRKTLYVVGKEGPVGIPKVVSVTVTDPANVVVNFGASQTSGTPFTPYFINSGGYIFFRGSTMDPFNVLRCDDQNCTTITTIPLRNTNVVVDLWGPFRINGTHIGWIEATVSGTNTSFSASFLDSSSLVPVSIGLPLELEYMTTQDVQVVPTSGGLRLIAFNGSQEYACFFDAYESRVISSWIRGEMSTVVQSDYSPNNYPMLISQDKVIFDASTMDVDAVSKLASAYQGIHFASLKRKGERYSVSIAFNATSGKNREFGLSVGCPPTSDPDSSFPVGVVAAPLQVDDLMMHSREFAIVHIEDTGAKLIYMTTTLNGLPITGTFDLFPSATNGGSVRPVLGDYIVGKIGSNSTLLLNGVSSVSTMGPLIISKLDQQSRHTFETTLVDTVPIDPCLSPLKATAFATSPDGRFLVFATEADSSYRSYGYIYDFVLNVATPLKAPGDEHLFWLDSVIGGNRDLPVVFLKTNNTKLVVVGYSQTYSTGALFGFADGGLLPVGVPLSLILVNAVPTAAIHIARSNCGNQTALYYTCETNAVCSVNPDDPSVVQVFNGFSISPAIFEELDGSVLATPLGTLGEPKMRFPYCNITVEVVSAHSDLLYRDILPLPNGEHLIVAHNSTSSDLQVVRCGAASSCIPESMILCSACSTITPSFLGRTDNAFFLYMPADGLPTANLTAVGYALGSDKPQTLYVKGNADKLWGLRAVGPNFAIAIAAKSIIVIDTTAIPPLVRTFENPLGPSFRITNFEVLTNSHGGFEVVLQASLVQLWGSLNEPRIVTAQYIFCYEDVQCGPNSICHLANYTCSEVPGGAPVNPPANPPALSVPAAAPEVPCPSNSFKGACVGGVWYIQGNLTFNSTFSDGIISGPLFVNGSLIATDGTTLQFSDNASITVAGCVALGGATVSVKQPAPTQSVVTNGTIPLIYFDGGYCSGTTDEFANATLEFENAPACSEQTSDVNYGERSIVMLFSFQSTGCGPAQDAMSSGLTTGAIIGIVIAALVVVAILIASVVCIKFRRQVRPFDERGDKPAKPDKDYELEES